MKRTRYPKKTIGMVFAIILSISMIFGLTMTTAIAADFDAEEDLTALSRHVAGIEEIADSAKLDAANLTGDDEVNAKSLVGWARSLLDQSPDLTIKKEKTVTGGTYNNVIIDAAVGNDTVKLDGVTIEGQLIVQGGSPETITVTDCTVPSVVLDADFTLTEDTVIPAGKSVEVAAGKTLTLQGSLRVYGTLTNHGTIIGSGMNVEVYGGLLENEGTIDLNGALLTIEKGAVLNNFVGDIDSAKTSGTINAEINFVDYYYADTEYLCRWNVVEDDHTLDIDGNSRMVIAAVFDINKISTALNKTVPITVTGEDGPVSIDVCKYNAVLLSGTEADSTVHLGGLTVPDRMMLILKDSVFDGTNTYRNTYVVDNDAELTVAPGGMLISRGGASLTVASGSKLTANGYMVLETLTVNGHVYTEEGGMDVTTALTVNEGGVLEVGSGSSLNYWGENAAVINGKLIKTVRNVNGFDENVTSDINGKGVTPNETLTTLVFWDNVVLTGDHTVDTVVAYDGTLCVAPGGSLKYKNVYRGEGYTGEIIGPTTGPDDNGYTTLTSNATGVSTYADLVAALEDASVTYVIVDADLTVPSGDDWTQLDITKPVVIADGKTFTVAHYDGDDPQSQLIMNEVVIKGGGSLTLGEGATLTATEKRSGDNEMFYRYFGRVYVDYGGVLDVSHGNVTDGSAIYYNYGEENSNRIIVGENNIPDNIAFEVHNEEQLRGAMADPKCTGGIETDMDIKLTEDLTVTKFLLINDYQTLIVPENVTLTVPEGQTLQLSGQMTVNGGTVINRGTIYGFNIIDFYGGLLENDGTIEGMFAPNDRGEIECISTLILEKGAVLHNYTGDKATATKSGTINDVINFCDYWYADKEPLCCDWDVLEGDHSLDIDGNNRVVIAVAFGSDQVQAALNHKSYWGENDENSAYTYNVVMASGTEAENEVTLNNLTVNPYQTLFLKEWVDVGDTTYRNAIYNLNGITFEEGAGMVIQGDPAINVTGSLDYSRVRVNGNPTITAPGFVHNADELEEALAAGGDIYLNALAQSDKTKIEMENEDGEVEVSYENQYHVTTTEISKNTNLISMTNEPLAVFFKDGFTVAAGTTLQFHGLNVVAANDSTVNGTVEAHDGILVVQGPGNTTLTNNGTIMVGTPDEWGALAIFDNGAGNRIVNNGAIECFGEIIALGEMQESGQFTGNEPLWYANYRDLVCDLCRDFGILLPQQIDFETENEWGIEDLHWVYDYPDGGSEFFNEDYPEYSDYDAIGAFSLLIKNGIIPEYDEETSPELRPWHYVARDEVGNLLNAFARKVLDDETVGIHITGSGLVCRADTIPVENEDWYTSEFNLCFNALREALRPLTARNVETEDDFLNALDIPYVTEIHITDDITLNGRYYKDGQRVASADETDDKQLAVYLWAAGQDRNEWRMIFVEPGVTLTVAQGVKMDIQHNVELWLSDGEDGRSGKLYLYGGLNVFGGLQPGNWDEEYEENGQRYRKYVIEENDSYINFFPDVMSFAEDLYRRVEDYGLDCTVTDTVKNSANEWPDGDDRESFFAFAVKYGLQPHTETDDSGEDYIVWRPYDTIRYGEVMTVLENLYDPLSGNVTLPYEVKLNGYEDDWFISGRDIETLLCAFVNALPQREDATESFTIIRDNEQWGEESRGNDGMTVTGKKFTEAVTITCDPRYLNGDDFGGELRFQNCTFTKGVTVQALDGVGFRVDFTNSCGGDNGPAAVTVLPADGNENPHNVDLAGVNNMNIDTRTYTHIEDVKDQTFDLTFAGSTIRFDGKDRFDNNTNNYFDVDVRWDDDGDGNRVVPCIQINAEERWYNEEDNDGNGAVRLVSIVDEKEKPVAPLNCKLRVCGFVDVSGIALGEDGWIELASDRWRSDVELGSNEITVCGDCGGEYSFTGSGTVCVPDRNNSAHITVNDVDLGQPHIFGGEEPYGIFFPLSTAAGIEFGVEQYYWDEENGDIWQPLNYHVEDKNGENGVHLIGAVREEDGEPEPWIWDPDCVRVSVKLGGCTVIYDTLWWKPISVGEFLELLNDGLKPETPYTLSDVNDKLNADEFLTFGAAKELLNYAWDQYPGEGDFPIESVINDWNYFWELDQWQDSDDPNKGDWNPDNWTRTWGDARYLLDNLKRELGIVEEPEEQVIDTDVILTLRRHPSDDEEYPWRDTVIVDTGDGEPMDYEGNWLEDCRFTGSVTVTCDPNCIDGESFGGRVFLQNCAFEQDVTVLPVDGVTFCVDFTNSCICGTEDAPKAVNVSGLDAYSYDANGNYNNWVELCGIGNMNVNADTYVRINGVKDQQFNLTFNCGIFLFDGIGANNEYSVDVRWDRWKEQGDTDFRSEPCVQLNAESYDGVGAVVVATPESCAYTGKLRVAGCLDVSGVNFGENARIELAAHYNQENPNWSDCQNSRIELGTNEILIGGDASGDHNFTGTGTVRVLDRNNEVQLTINDVDLGTPHIFGSGDYGIYLGLTDWDGVNIQLQEGGTPLNFLAALFNEDGPVDDSTNPIPTKTHLQSMMYQPWITDPYNVRLYVTVGGCTAIYDPLYFKGE